MRRGMSAAGTLLLETWAATIVVAIWSRPPGFSSSDIFRLSSIFSRTLLSGEIQSNAVIVMLYGPRYRPTAAPGPGHRRSIRRESSRDAFRPRESRDPDRSA